MTNSTRTAAENGESKHSDENKNSCRHRTAHTAQNTRRRHKDKIAKGQGYGTDR